MFNAVALKAMENISEAFKETYVKESKELSPLQSSMEAIENSSLESLKAENELVLKSDFILTQETRGELPPMAEGTRGRLEENGYPESVLNNIGSEAEAVIYEEANIKSGQVNDKDVLIRTDINYDQKDVIGDTNLERMEKGKAPLDINGKPIELHHIGQKQDSPLAELTSSEHRGKGNDNILHNKIKESQINREDFNKERQEHWKERAEQIKINNQRELT